ncbi:MAG: F-box protein [Verrucomicrobia bacterium]|nr:F-box protein [Verrucomicrobiota bacterium]
MASRIALVPTEGYNCLPPEILFRVLSHLDVQALGRIARVSKALLGISEDNALWKSLYARQWTLPTEWIDREPPKWKDYYLTVVKVRKCAPEDFEDERAISNFWCFGLPDESANYKARQKTLALQRACVMVANGAIPNLVEDDKTKIQPSLNDEGWEDEDWNGANKAEIMWSFQFPNSSKNLQRNILKQPAACISLLVPDSEDHRIFFIVFRILSLHHLKDQTQAVKLYLDNRKKLSKYSSLLGWWLSEVLFPDKAQHKNPDKITLPIHKNPPKRKRQNFLQGFFLIWLRHGEPATHFNTLRALRKIAHDSKLVYHDALSHSGTFLEELIVWNLCRNNSSIALEKLANLYLYFPHHSPREEELKKAIFLYDRVIRSFPADLIPLHLGTNYCLGWLGLKENDAACVPNERESLLPVSIFQKALHHRDPMRIKDLKCVADFTYVFEVKRAYPFIRACLNWIRFPLNEKTLQDMVFLLCTKINFFQQIGNFAEAFDDWINLCFLFAKEKKAKLEKSLDLFQTLYSILNASKEICEEALLLRSQIPEVKLAVAYALYRLNRIDESLRIMVQIARYFYPSDLEWLKTLGQADLRAAVIYSLCLETVEELEQYYLEEMLDYHHTQRFFIYHNLATRIYFIEKNSDEEDDATRALDHAEEAIRIDPHQPETHILIGLCHIYNGDGAEGQAAIKVGETLLPEKFSLKKQYTEKDLLIFPIE